MAATTIRQLTVDGVRSPVREAGPPHAREAVVFVHGNPGSSEDWVDLVQRTGDFARAIAPDMPGYGKAERHPRFDYTVEGFARHLDGLLEQLGVERVHLVLHDFGGPWGLTWASEHLARVASLTLVNIGVLPGYRWHKFARLWRIPVVGELFMLTASRRAFHALTNADNPRPFPPAFLDRMYDDFDAGARKGVLKLYRATNDLGAMVERIARITEFKKLPTLVVWGTGDKFLPQRYAHVQADYFDVREVRLMERCGHWPFIDEPEAAAATIVPFLRARVTGEPRESRAS